MSNKYFNSDPFIASLWGEQDVSWSVKKPTKEDNYENRYCKSDYTDSVEYITNYLKNNNKYDGGVNHSMYSSLYMNILPISSSSVNLLTTTYITGSITASMDSAFTKVESPYSTVREKFPITNDYWIRYNSTTDGIPVELTQSETTLKTIDRLHNDGIPIYIARSRMVRNINALESIGHITDPWNRSIHTYSSKFKTFLSSRHQTKIEANHCEEILVWQSDTTLNGKDVTLIIWEKVKLSYVRKKAIENFIASLLPDRVKNDSIYEV